MKKLCNKECWNCNLDECVQKWSPWDWMSIEQARSEDSKAQRRNYIKRKRDLCIAFGVCRECLCKPATYGLKCTSCHVKEIKRNAARRKDIPRHERPKYGRCYFCGDPVEKGFKTCPKCHKIMAVNMLKGKANVNMENHYWRKMDRANVERIHRWKEKEGITNG